MIRLLVLLSLLLLAKVPCSGDGLLQKVPLARKGTNDSDRRNAAFVHIEANPRQTMTFSAEVSSGGNNVIAGLVVGYDQKTGSGLFFGLDDRFAHGISLYSFDRSGFLLLDHRKRANDHSTFVRLKIRREKLMSFYLGSEKIFERALDDKGRSRIGLFGSTNENDAGTYFDDVRLVVDQNIYSGDIFERSNEWRAASPPFFPRYKTSGFVAVDRPFGIWKDGSNLENDYIPIGFAVPGRGRIIVHRDHAFIPPGEGQVQIVDISKPEKPRFSGLVPGGFLTNLAIFRDRLIMPSSAGLRYLDVSNPKSPGPLSTIDLKTGGKIRAVDQLGDNGLFAMTTPENDRFLFLVDLDKIARPKILGSLKIPGSKGSWYFKREGKRLYLALNDGRFALVDITKPADPTLLGLASPARGEEWRLLTVRNRIAFFAVAKIDRRFSLIKAIDWSVPSKIVILKERELPELSNVEDGEVKADRLYLVDSVERHSLHTVNQKRSVPSKILIVDPNNLDDIADFIPEGLAELHTISFSDDLVILNDYNYGMRLLKKKPDSNGLSEVSSYVSAGEGHYLTALKTRVAYFQTFGGSALIFGDQGEKGPTRIGTYWDGSWLYSKPAAIDDILYIPNNAEVSIVTTALPDRPLKTGSFEQVPYPFGTMLNPHILVSDGKAYILCMIEKSHRTFVPVIGYYDLSDPQKPKLLSSTTLIERKNNAFTPLIALDGDTVYVHDPVQKKMTTMRVNKELVFEELKSFSDTRLIGSERFNIDYCGRFAVYKGVVYLLFAGPQKPAKPVIQIIDFQSTPKIAAELSLAYESYFVDLLVSGDTLILGDYFYIGLLDLSDPLRPKCAMKRRLDGSNIWTLGMVRANRLYYPRLDGVGILTLPGIPRTSE